jgi:hypothetical protein
MSSIPHRSSLLSSLRWRSESAFSAEMASSNGYLNRYYFMISPNCEVFFKNTTTLIAILQGMINFYTEKIKSISIPTSVEILRSGCFADGKFERITIPADSHLREIEISAFAGCTSLVSIFIPSSVQVLGPRCFYNCVSLEMVTFGASSRLKVICERAFVGCSSLKSIDFSELHPTKARSQITFSREDAPNVTISSETQL